MEKNISNREFSKLLIDSLSNNNVKYACIAPGSRNMPLAQALINNEHIKCFSHIDERSMCYFGVGLAKNTGHPVIILTTSGTATANLLPAIIEAQLSHTPLIAITADRPEEMINSGVPQTINQTNIYGNHVNAAIDIEHEKMTLSESLNKISDFLSLCGKKKPGPIHINIRFNEPLYDSLSNIKTNIKPFSKPKINDNEKIILPKFEKPIIVCGPLRDNEKNDNILSFAKKINAPILTDILSQFRFSNKKNHALVRYESYIEKIDGNPDIIIRFGDKPICKKLNLFLEKHKSKTILINEFHNINDDSQKQIKIKYDFLLSNIETKYKGSELWINQILNLEKNASKLSKFDFPEKNYQKLVKNAIQTLKNNDSIFLGNSMLIRMFDKFSEKTDKNIRIYGNHITRGIDGLISTSLGCAFSNTKGKNYLFIGDVSFFYDLNAFHILKHENINLNIIVANNNGGQILRKQRNKRI